MVSGHSHNEGELTPDLHGPEVQHKTGVEPIFLAYKRVSSESN